jgi:quercetin dioxygenase-like cupin family protein
MTVRDDTADQPAPDPFAWRLEVTDEQAGGNGAMRRFSIATDPTVDGRSPARLLSRGDSLTMYARTFGDGNGERPLHSHDDESCWIVLAGEARFFDETDEQVAHLRTGEGIFVPRGARYRFLCSGPETTLLRVASRC